MEFFNLGLFSLVEGENGPIKCRDRVLDKIKEGENKLSEIDPADIWHMISAGTDVQVKGCYGTYRGTPLPFIVVPIRGELLSVVDNCIHYIVIYNDRVVVVGKCSPSDMDTYEHFRKFIRGKIASYCGHMSDAVAKSMWDVFGWLGSVLYPYPY